MSRAYLGIGSNVDAERHIRIAVDALRDEFGDVLISTLYRSKAVGFEGDDFINLAVMIETAMGPLELRGFLRDLEADNGRDRSAPKWSDRTLDIDILLYDDLVVYDDQLEIPRREILKFPHVLKPLTDIVGDLPHPVRGASFQSLWKSMDGDAAELIPVSSNFLK